MLFTFPSRYWFAIGLTGVFSLTGWSRRIRAGFLVSRVTQDTTRLTLASCRGLSPSMVTLSKVFHSRLPMPRRGPTTPAMHCYNAGLGSSPFARHYWGNHCLFSLPAGTKMFQFPALASAIKQIYALQTYRLSHSEIPGSTVICTYPGLIAAYHVLHRLCEPRHPPCALFYFFSRQSFIHIVIPHNTNQ